MGLFSKLGPHVEISWLEIYFAFHRLSRSCQVDVSCSKYRAYPCKVNHTHVHSILVRIRSIHLFRSLVNIISKSSFDQPHPSRDNGQKQGLLNEISSVFEVRTFDREVLQNSEMNHDIQPNAPPSMHVQGCERCCDCLDCA